MDRAMSWVPAAASSMERPISAVVTDCSSTAAAIVAEISLIRSMVSPMRSLASTAPAVSVWIGLDPRRDLLGGLRGLVGELFDPRWRPRRSPCRPSPARAASMVALSASRLVCSAMELMTLDDVADLFGGLAELGHRLGGGAGHRHRVGGDLGGLRWRWSRPLGSRRSSARSRRRPSRRWRRPGRRSRRAWWWPRWRCARPRCPWSMRPRSVLRRAGELLGRGLELVDHGLEGLDHGAEGVAELAGHAVLEHGVRTAHHRPRWTWLGSRRWTTSPTSR